MLQLLRENEAPPAKPGLVITAAYHGHVRTDMATWRQGLTTSSPAFHQSQEQPHAD
jgi:hypothetical protein